MYMHPKISNNIYTRITSSIQEYTIWHVTGTLLVGIYQDNMDFMLKQLLQSFIYINIKCVVLLWTSVII